MQSDVERQRTSVASAMSENVDAMAAFEAALSQNTPPSDEKRQRLTDVLNKSVATVERREAWLDKSEIALEDAKEAYSLALWKTERYEKLLREAAPDTCCVLLKKTAICHYYLAQSEQGVET